MPGAGPVGGLRGLYGRRTYCGASKEQAEGLSQSMTDILTAPAGSQAPLTGHEETRAKAGFWSLTLGSIGVVYGDIGTSPLYALREAVQAAVGAGNTPTEPVV